MIVGTLRDGNRLVCLYESDDLVVNGETGVEVSLEQHKQIVESLRFGDWVYENGNFIHSPEALPAPIPPIGEIPVTEA